VAPSELIPARLRQTWSFRTRAEIEASARFARMADDLAAIGAQPVTVQGAREASEDEARHRDLCALVAQRFGDPDPRSYVAPRVRIGRTGMDERDRVLWEMTSVCIAETMNTALLTRSQEVAKDEDIKRTVHELLKDEVNHARLGWGHLAAERAAGRGAFLRDILPLMLEASIEPGFLEGKLDQPWVDAMFDYGELPFPELRQIYFETMNEVILKGMDAMGLDTSQGREWLARFDKIESSPSGSNA
jgi:hypothetical protein